MDKELPIRAPLSITAFALIDGAMVRVVKAAAAYETAIYTSKEGGAIKQVVKEAIGLKQAFVKAAQAADADYVLEQEILNDMNKQVEDVEGKP